MGIGLLICVLDRLPRQRRRTSLCGMNPRRAANYLPGPLILLALPPGGGAGDAKARRSYDLAAASATDLPPDPYSDTVRDGIEHGLERVAAERSPDVTGSMERDDER